jgi:lysylphosphatidylglycerol synthetase-like protein (DUF2156 family)
MPSFDDILIWVVIVVVALSAAPILARLAITRGQARRSPPGAHARPVLAEPGERGKAWHEIRALLLVPSAVVASQVVGSKDHTLRWLLGIAIFLIVIWELGSLLGLSEPGARKEARRKSRWVLLLALGTVFTLAEGWKYDTLWWLALVMFLILAPDLDSWLRARLSRGSGDGAIEPP